MKLAALAPFLVVGSGGMLGRAWLELLAKQNLEFSAVRRAELDVTDLKSIDHAVRPGVRTLVNCAAWTDVDGAEADEASANAVNATGVGLLAERCRALSATMIHYSTDYVFDGSGSVPWRRDSTRRPVNAYGRSKLRGELALEASAARYLLLRTSWLYAPWGKNFVRTIARLARQRDVLRVVNDQRGSPTSAEQLAERSLALLEHDAQGVFHVTDAGECSWYEFARVIAAAVRPACRVEPCSSAEHERAAQRPMYSTLDTSTTAELIGSAKSWKTCVKDVVARLDDSAP